MLDNCLEFLQKDCYDVTNNSLLHNFYTPKAPLRIASFYIKHDNDREWACYVLPNKWDSNLTK